MDRATVEDWLARYVRAWASVDAAEIRALFTDDAEYRYHPWDEPVRGAGAIVADWTREPDAPGSWTAAYEPYAVGEDTAVAVGVSKYLDADGSVDREYHNAFLLRFDAAGRCASFTEFFMRRPKPQAGA